MNIWATRLDLIISKINEGRDDLAQVQLRELEAEMLHQDVEEKEQQPQLGIIKTTLLMNSGDYESALEIIDHALYFEPNNYELYYCGASCLENMEKAEDAYLYYSTSILLSKDTKDSLFINNAFLDFCSHSHIEECAIAESAKKFIEHRLSYKEYNVTYQLLTQWLYDPQSPIAKEVISEEVMLYMMMLEIVLCERNSMTENEFWDDNSMVRYHNNVSEFKKVYDRMKLSIRRIWFGLDLKKQWEINKILETYQVSDDMLAVVTKYSAREEVWQNLFCRLEKIISEQHPQTAQVIGRYYEWLKNQKIGGQDKCMEPDDFDNHAIVTRLDFGYMTKSRPELLLENTICIIYCTNDELYSAECKQYLKRLEIPDGISLHIVEVWNAPSMAAGYNQAMKWSTAKYKLYIHQDTFIIKRNALMDMVDILQRDETLGAVGIFGSVAMNPEGLWWKCDKPDLRMIVYQDIILNIMKSRSIVKKGKYEYGAALDGIYIGTSVDVPWREDLFDGWHFYDISQCYEIRRAGKNTALINDENIWALHETTMRKDPMHLYEKYQQIFLKQYGEDISTGYAR